MGDFRKLRVWRKAHALAINAHRVANRIRGQQYASFRNQIIRSAMSVPANIVEGRAQKSEAVFVRFLRISVGSITELEYHLLAARDLGAISQRDYFSLMGELEEVRMMLYGLVRRLEGSRSQASPAARKVNQS